MEENDLEKIEGMIARHVGVFAESVNHKFDILVEGHKMLSEKIDRVEQRLDGRIDCVIRKLDAVAAQGDSTAAKLDAVAAQADATAAKLDAVAAQGDTTAAKLDNVAAKLDAVAADLTAHRRDTEAHSALYKVREEK
jgi:ABC-type transporter Mla subunit MlaD